MRIGARRFVCIWGLTHETTLMASYILHAGKFFGTRLK